MPPEALTPWLLLVTSFIGALTAVGAAGLWMWKQAIWPGFRGLVEDAVAPMNARVEGLMEIVQRELTSNGGGSIKDRVKAIDGLALKTAADLLIQSSEVERLLAERSKKVDAKFDSLANRLTAIEVRMSRETQKVIESVAAASTPAAVAVETLEVGKETLTAVEKVDTKLDEAMGKPE